MHEAKPLPMPPIHKKEEFFFQDHELFTPLFNRVIHLEGDPTLAAKVQRY